MSLLLNYIVDKLSAWAGINDNVFDANKLVGISWMSKFNNFKDAKAYLMGLKYKYCSKKDAEACRRFRILNGAFYDAKYDFHCEDTDDVLDDKGEFRNC